jgi:hypothetical protein
MVVSAAALEFEACMADRKAKSLFEVALVAKYLSQLHSSLCQDSPLLSLF